MITANELRIGNLTSMGVVYEIQQSKFYVLNDKEESFNSAWAEIEPIPLTEEWLLRFEFFRHHHDYSNGFIYIKNVIDNTEFEWGVYPNEIGSGIQIVNRKKIQYVHQLQNIFYAITQTELTLSKP